MKAWVFQDDKQVKKVGKKIASHYVGWIDPDGVRRSKSCGAGRKGKQLAEKERDKIAAQLITGTYQSVSAKTWEDFREEYKTQVLDGMGTHNRHETELALDNFENVVKPNKMQKVTTAAILDYIAKRRKDPGRGEPEALLSPATVNKELRHLRAVFRKAKKLGYLKEAPEFDFLKEAKKLPTYTTPEHFAKMYAACDKATYPKGLPYPPVDWWRGVLITAFMTGWRIGSTLPPSRRRGPRRRHREVGGGRQQRQARPAGGHPPRCGRAHEGRRQLRAGRLSVAPRRPAALRRVRAHPAYPAHQFPPA